MVSRNRAMGARCLIVLPPDRRVFGRPGANPKNDSACLSVPENERWPTIRLCGFSAPFCPAGLPASPRAAGPRGP